MRGGIWQAVARRPPRGTIVPSASTASTTMIATPDYRALLDTAIEEARTGLSEGGIPIGAALYHQDGRLRGCCHKRRLPEAEPSVHGEPDAIRKAGRTTRHRATLPAPTLAPSRTRRAPTRPYTPATMGGWG